MQCNEAVKHKLRHPFNPTLQLGLRCAFRSQPSSSIAPFSWSQSRPPIVNMFDVNGKWVNWEKYEVRTCQSVMNLNPTQIDPCHLPHVDAFQGSRKAKPVAQPTLLLNLRCRQAQGDATATTWQQARISFKQIVFMTTPTSHYPDRSIPTRKEDPDCAAVKQMQRATSNSNPLQGDLYPFLCYSGCPPIRTCQHHACCLARHLRVLICPRWTSVQYCLCWVHVACRHESEPKLNRSPGPPYNGPPHQPPLHYTRFHARHSTQLLPSFAVDVLRSIDGNKIHGSKEGDATWLSASTACPDRQHQLPGTPPPSCVGCTSRRTPVAAVFPTVVDSATGTGCGWPASRSWWDSPAASWWLRHYVGEECCLDKKAVGTITWIKKCRSGIKDSARIANKNIENYWKL